MVSPDLLLSDIHVSIEKGEWNAIDADVFLRLDAHCKAGRLPAEWMNLGDSARGPSCGADCWDIYGHHGCALRHIKAQAAEIERLKRRADSLYADAVEGREGASWDRLRAIRGKIRDTFKTEMVSSHLEKAYVEVAVIRDAGERMAELEKQLAAIITHHREVGRYVPGHDPECPICAAEGVRDG